MVFDYTDDAGVDTENSIVKSVLVGVLKAPTEEDFMMLVLFPLC